MGNEDSVAEELDQDAYRGLSLCDLVRASVGVVSVWRVAPCSKPTRLRPIAVAVPSFKIEVGIAVDSTARLLVAVQLTSNNEMRRSVDSHSPRSESPDGKQRWFPCSTPCLWLSYCFECSDTRAKPN